MCNRVVFRKSMHLEIVYRPNETCSIYIPDIQSFQKIIKEKDQRMHGMKVHVLHTKFYKNATYFLIIDINLYT